MALTKKSATKFEAPEDNQTAVVEKSTVAAATPQTEAVKAEATVIESKVASKEEVKTPEVVVEVKGEAAAEVKTEAASTVTAVAVKPAAAVAVASKKFQAALQEYANAIDPAELDFNTFSRVTVGLDGFSDDKGEDLGKVMKLQLMSYNERFVISPGTDEDEAKPFVRYSLDGITIESGDDAGVLVADYLEKLRVTDGYDKASVKKYLNIIGFLSFANDAEIDPEDRIIISLQVPPQSRAVFQRHQITMGVKVAQGIMVQSDILVCRQEKQGGSNGSKKYATIDFSHK